MAATVIPSLSTVCAGELGRSAATAFDRIVKTTDVKLNIRAPFEDMAPDLPEGASKALSDLLARWRQLPNVVEAIYERTLARGESTKIVEIRVRLSGPDSKSIWKVYNSLSRDASKSPYSLISRTSTLSDLYD